MDSPRASQGAAGLRPTTSGSEPSALAGKIADLIGQCADVRVTYDSVQRQYTHVANADELAASIMRMVDAAKTDVAQAILGNLRPEVREEVAYAIQLATAACPICEGSGRATWLDDCEECRP